MGLALVLERPVSRGPVSLTSWSGRMFVEKKVPFGVSSSGCLPDGQSCGSWRPSSCGPPVMPLPLCPGQVRRSRLVAP